MLYRTPAHMPIARECRQELRERALRGDPEAREVPGYGGLTPDEVVEQGRLEKTIWRKYDA